MSTVGLRKFGRRSGAPLHVSFDGSPEYLAFGHTIDWSQIPAATVASQLADGTDILPGDQYILQGTVMTRTVDSDGNLGMSVIATGGGAVADPPAAPTLATATTTGTLVPGTYYVKYAWYQTIGGVNYMSKPSAEAQIVVPAGTNTNTITVTSTIALPAGATGIVAYISTVSGAETQAATAAANTVVVTALPAAGAAAPNATSSLLGLLVDRTFVLDSTVFQSDQLSDLAGGPIIGGKVWLARVRVGGVGQPTLAALRAACPRMVFVEQ